MLNFGHHEDSDAIAESFDALVESLPGDPAVVALMQNPHAGEDSQRAKVRAIREWGEQTQTPVLNVFTAFTGDDRGLDSLLDDQGVLPNWDGAALWADHVFTELESE